MCLISFHHVPYTQARELTPSSNTKLVVPKPNYVETERRAFGVRAPLELNKLPASKECRLLQSYRQNSSFSLSI